MTLKSKTISSDFQEETRDFSKFIQAVLAGKTSFKSKKKKKHG